MIMYDHMMAIYYHIMVRYDHMMVRYDHMMVILQVGAAEEEQPVISVHKVAKGSLPKEANGNYKQYDIGPHK